MNKLKPCPFCGGEASLRYAYTADGEKTVSIVCDECRTGIFKAMTEKTEVWDGWTIENADECIRVWNSRKRARG